MSRTGALRVSGEGFLYKITYILGYMLALLAVAIPAHGSVEQPERGILAVIDRTEIEMSGAADLWEVLSSRDDLNVYGIAGLAATRGVSYLLDGRRTTGLDFSAFPLSAVRRIEIMEEGNANISRHTPGVIVNIVTGRSADIAEVSGYAGRPVLEGADTNQASAVWAGGLGRSRVLVAAERSTLEEVREADRDHTRTRWVPGGTFEGTQGVSTAGNTIYIEGIGAHALGDCDPDVYLGVLGEPRGRSGEGCAFSYGDIAWASESFVTDTLLASVEHPAGEGAKVYADLRVTQSESRDREAPPAGVLNFEAAPGSAVRQSLIDAVADLTESNFPSDNAVTVDHRFVGYGNRNYLQTNDVSVLTLGIHGEFADGLEYDIRGHHQRSRSLQKAGNFVSESAVVEAIESGAYDIVNPLSTEQAHLDAVRATIVRRTYDWASDISVARAEVAGTAFELPGGPVRWTAVGTSVWNEWEGVYDHRNAEGRSFDGTDIAGVGSAVSSGGEQTTTITDVAATLPVSTRLDVSLGGQRINYDYAGHVLGWTVFARYRPNGFLTLRARRSEWQGVPGWSDLYGPKVTSFPYVCDTSSQPCSQQQVETETGGNPSLEPSESNSSGIGATFSIDGLSIAADWYRSETDGSPARVSVQRLVDLEAAGRSLPAGAAVNRDAASNIQSIENPVLNSGESESQNAAVSVGAAVETGWAALDLNLHVLRRVSRESRVAGLVQPGDSPRHRAHASLKATRGDVTASWNGYMRSGYWNATRTGRWSRWTGHDIALRWRDAFGVDGLAIAGGVLNIENSGPAFNPASPDTPSYTHDSRRGRTFFLRASMSW